MTDKTESVDGPKDVPTDQIDIVHAYEIKAYNPDNLGKIDVFVGPKKKLGHPTPAQLAKRKK